MLPNFIIAGAARSGTTSLYQYCLEHPDIFMSQVKETNFFSSNPFGFTPRTYEKLFDQAGEAMAVGEASPSYLYEESAPRAISKAIPYCRIVIILRNPIERLISDFFYSQSWGANLDRDLNDFVTACLTGEGAGRQGFVPALMAKKGLYGEQVRRYMEIFPPEQLFIRLYEDLRSDPYRLLSDLFTFIEVDPAFRPAFERVHNANSEVVVPLLSRVVRRGRRIEETFLDPFLPSPWKGYVTNAILNANRRRRSRESMQRSVTSQDRERLLSFYRNSVLELQDLIGRDLSNWLAVQCTCSQRDVSLYGSGERRDD